MSDTGWRQARLAEAAGAVGAARGAVGWMGLAAGIAILLGGCVFHGVPPDVVVGTADWGSFYKAFQTAAAARDRTALRGMMTAKFDYTYGDGDPVPERAFAFWDREEIKGWEALAAVARAGAVDYSPPAQWGLHGRVKIAPPEAAKAGYRQWRAVFAEQEDGEWRFAAFLQGD